MAPSLARAADGVLFCEQFVASPAQARSTKIFGQDLVYTYLPYQEHYDFDRDLLSLQDKFIIHVDPLPHVTIAYRGRKLHAAWNQTGDNTELFTRNDPLVSLRPGIAFVFHSPPEGFYERMDHFVENFRRGARTTTCATFVNEVAGEIGPLGVEIPRVRRAADLAAALLKLPQETRDQVGMEIISLGGEPGDYHRQAAENSSLNGNVGQRALMAATLGVAAGSGCGSVYGFWYLIDWLL